MGIQDKNTKNSMKSKSYRESKPVRELENRESGLYVDTFGTVFGLRIKANTGYSAGLSFLGCPMRPTSS